MTTRTFTCLHLFAGIGGGALGFQQARGQWAGLQGRFRTLAGIDVDPAACRDFARTPRLAGSGKAACCNANGTVA